MQVLSSFPFIISWHIRICRGTKAIHIVVIVQLAAAKDPESAFFKRLEGLQPCEVSELKAGTHIFAVYGMTYYFTYDSWSIFETLV